MDVVLTWNGDGLIMIGPHFDQVLVLLLLLLMSIWPCMILLLQQLVLHLSWPWCNYLVFIGVLITFYLVRCYAAIAVLLLIFSAVDMIHPSIKQHKNGNYLCYVNRWYISVGPYYITASNTILVLVLLLAYHKYICFCFDLNHYNNKFLFDDDDSCSSNNISVPVSNIEWEYRYF